MAVGNPKYDAFLKAVREEDPSGGLDWQASVLDKDLSDPPGAPNLGDRYIVAPVGINAWTGHDNDIAEWNGVGWDYFAPDEGTAAWVEDEDKTYVFNGASWVTMGSTMLHTNLQGLGADDHTQYLLHDGSRAMTGDLNMGSKDIDSAIDVNAERHNIPTKKVDCRVFTDAGINAALAELGANGGEVYLPEGVYVCTGSITIPVANVTLRGAGKGTILDASTLQDFHVIITAQNDTVIDSLQIKGKADGGESFDLINADGATALIVKDCLLADSDRYGIYAKDTDNAVLHDNIFSNEDDWAVYCVSAERMEIESNLVTSSKGFFVDGTSTYANIANNHIYGGAFGADINADSCGVYNNFIHLATEGIDVSSDACEVVGNQIIGGASYCLDISGAANNVSTNMLKAGTVLHTARITGDGNVINSNLFTSGADTQDQLFLDTANYCVVVGNVFTNPSDGERAINLTDSTDCLIQGNQSDGHATCGLELNVGSVNCSIGGNKFRDATPIIDAASGHVYQLNSDLNMGTKEITNVGNVDGVDVSDHHARHEDGGADEIDVSGLSGVLTDDQPSIVHDLGGVRHNADTLSDLNSKVNDAVLADKVRMIDPPISPQIVSGGEVSEGTNPGTVKVAVLGALLRTGVADTDPLIYKTFAGQDNIALLAAETVYHVVLQYNAGVLQISIQAGSANGTTDIGIGDCMKQADNTVHYTNSGMRLQNGVAKLHRRAATLRNTELASGCAIGDDADQRFSMQPGVVYHGINRLLPFLAGAYHSLADKFVYAYGDDVNGWTYVPNSTDIDNTQYYDGAGGLATLLNTTKYACHWVYLHPDDEHAYVVYGTCSGTLAEAEQAQPPADLPLRIESFAALIGCIIIKKSDTTFTTIQMVTDRFFTGTAVADHGQLAGLDDDDHLQYLLHDGSRAMTGDLNMGSKDIDSAIDVNAERHNIPTKKVDCRVFTNAGITACLAELGADGGEVYLPEGVYTITGTITIPQNNIVLRGAGRGTILDASAGQAFNVIDLNGRDYCSIRHLTIIGKTGETGDNELIYGVDATNLTIEGCIFKDADHYAISLNGADDSRIIGNYFEICNGLFLDDLICMNVSENVFNGGASAVIVEPGAYSVKIVNNQIYDTVGVSIHVQDELNEVRGNYVRNAGGHGIHVENGDRCKVLDNTVYESANDCDDILITGSDNCVISRNHCFSSVGNSERAIHLATSTDCLVTDNDSVGHDTCGLEMPAASVNCSIGGNKFRDATPVVDAASGHLFTITGHAEMYEAKIKVFKQDAEPTLHADDFAAFWEDTNDSNRTYLIFRRGGGDNVLVELT